MNGEEGAPVQKLALAVDETISNTIVEVYGGLPQSAVTMVSFVDADGEPAYSMVVTPGQGKITTVGLIRFATLLIEQQVLEGDDD